MRQRLCRTEKEKSGRYPVRISLFKLRIINLASVYKRQYADANIIFGGKCGMTRLDCTVTSCLFNKERCCCKDNIEVEGSGSGGALNSAKDMAAHARHSRDTCCASFRERGGDGVRSSVDIPAKNTDVACQVIECTFNENCHCQAKHIGIAGGAACDCRDTECTTFRCKCE